MTVPERSGFTVLVTGGAGFVGSSVAIALAARHPEWSVRVLDNLRRRGSELNLARLRAAGVEFVHGDIRQPADLATIGRIDALVECSAEPSVLSGFEGSPDYVIESNLLGAWRCLELAHRWEAHVVFLSTSRVYPVAGLQALRYNEAETRFELVQQQPLPGASAAGIAEDFPLAGPRTFYGTTKLAAEMLIEEYSSAYGLSAVIDRCGVIAGPWQMGKVDQGVFTWWMICHYFGRPLAYIGYGGTGKQVRDLLHVDDLVELVEDQILRRDAWAGCCVNVGGGCDVSLSLLETTAVCRQITGRTIEIDAVAENRPGDVPIYISDCAHLYARTEWRPRRGAEQLMVDIFEWVRGHERELSAALG
jgi:CDP-paratose 2-epimerase